MKSRYGTIRLLLLIGSFLIIAAVAVTLLRFAFTVLVTILRVALPLGGFRIAIALVLIWLEGRNRTPMSRG